MTQEPPQEQEHRGNLALALTELRARLSVQPITLLIDFEAADDDALGDLFDLAEGRIAVVVLRLRADAVFRGAGPPPPLPDLQNQVMAHAGELVRANVRASDLVMGTGPLEIAVVLLRAGPLEARAQTGRLRGLIAEQRFKSNDFEIRWRGRLGLGTYQGAAHLLGGRKVLTGLFASAN